MRLAGEHQGRSGMKRNIILTACCAALCWFGARQTEAGPSLPVTKPPP